MAMSPLHGCQAAAGGTREFCSFSFFFQVVSFRRRGPGGPVLLFIPLPESDSESDASDYSVPGLRTESDSDASDCRRRGRRDGREVRSDFNDIQLCLRQFCLNLNICKVTDDDSLPDFLRPKFEGDRHNFADIEIEAKLSWAKLDIVKK